MHHPPRKIINQIIIATINQPIKVDNSSINSGEKGIVLT